MRVTIIFIAIIISLSNKLTAQTRTIYGRVIAEDDMDVISGVRIQNKDKLIFGTTGTDGRFKINIPQNTQALLLSFIGYEGSIIILNSECDTIEVIMMASVTYDFISSGKIDRLRLKRFNKLPDLHLQAYKKGLFTNELICYSEEFKAHKPQLDSIEKENLKYGNKLN